MTIDVTLPQLLRRCLGHPDTRYASMLELHRELLILKRRMAPGLCYSVGAATTIGLEHLPDAVTATLQLEGEDDFENTDVDPQPPPVHEDTVESDPGMTRAAGAPTRRRRPAPTREELTSLLAQSRGSVAEVARRLNRQYAVIWRCIQRYGIDANKFRDVER